MICNVTNKKKNGLYFQGFYDATDIDTYLFNNANFPKTLFYGTYRFRFSFTKNNEIHGCFIMIIEIKRRWETNN